MSTSSPTKTPSAQNTDLDVGRKAIITEMDGLKALAESLDDNFTKAVEAIHHRPAGILDLPGHPRVIGGDPEVIELLHGSPCR